MKQTQPIGTPSNPNVCGTIKPNVKQSDETIKIPNSKIPNTNGTPRNAEITSQKETIKKKLAKLQEEEQSTIQNFRENLKKKLGDPNQNQKLDNAAYERESIESITKLLNKLKEHLTEQKNLLNKTTRKSQLTKIEKKLQQIENYQKHPLELAYEIECYVLQEIAIENIKPNENESQPLEDVKNLQSQAQQQLSNCPNPIYNSKILYSLKTQINDAQKQIETARKYINDQQLKTKDDLLDDIKNQFNQTKEWNQKNNKKKKKQKEHLFTINYIKKQTQELKEQLKNLISIKALFAVAQDTHNTQVNNHREYYSQKNITVRKNIIDDLEKKQNDLQDIYNDIQETDTFQKQNEEDNFLFGNQKINANKSEILWYTLNKENITNLANKLKEIDTESIDTESIQKNQKILNATALNNVTTIIADYSKKIKELDNLISSLLKQYDNLREIAQDMQRKATEKGTWDHTKEYDEKTNGLINDFLSENKSSKEMKETMLNMLNECKEQHRKILAPTEEETEEQTRQYEIRMQNMTNMANQFKKQ